MNSVILETPLLLVCFGIALALCVFGIFRRAGIVRLIAAAVFVGAFTYSLLLGAEMREVIIVTLLFLAVNIGGFAKGGKE